MAFGHKSLPTRKYTYGISHRPHGKGHKPNTPFPGQAAAMHQLYLAHKMQNELVAIELERRKKYKEILHQACPNLDTLEQQATSLEIEIATLRETLGKKNSAAQTTGSDKPLAALISAKVTECKAKWVSYTDEKSITQALPSVKAAANLSSREYKDKTKQLRGAAVKGGLYQGTAAHVMTRVKTTGHPPKFKRYTGEGLIAVQTQAQPAEDSELIPVLDKDGNPKMRGGKPLMQNTAYLPFTETDARAGARDTLLKIEPTANPKYVNVHLRIASDNRKPVWVVLPVIWHRPLAPNADIKWVYLSCRKTATYHRWEVQFDLAQPEWQIPEGRERATTGTVAVALGFRKIDGQLRVAHWVGDDGAEGEIVIPEDRLDAWYQVDDLQGIRDTRFEADKHALVAWLQNQPLSDEWKAKVDSLHLWKSSARLASLVLWWRRNRLVGDTDIFNRLEGEQTESGYTGGRRQDKHLYNWQESQRKNLRDWRKHYYRNLAVDLAKRYKDIAIAEINWAKLGEQPEIEAPEDRVFQRNRGIASVGMLKEILIQYLTPVEFSPVNLTRTCHRCGTVCESPGAGRWVVCERCGGVKTDRAVNAANNLLAHALGASAIV